MFTTDSVSMNTAIDAAVFGLQASQKLLHRMLADLEPEDFEKQPCEGANCISWVLGHLTIVDRRTLSMIGVTELPALPEGFEEKFLTTRTVAGVQTGLPPSTEIVKHFDETRALLLAKLPSFDPAKLNDKTPIERPMFRTYGEYLVFMGLHTSMHIGQMSLTRRVLGYPPLS